MFGLPRHKPHFAAHFLTFYGDLAMSANKVNWNRVGKCLVTATICSLPALGLADAEVQALTETAAEVEKFETGVKAMGGSIVGVTLVGSGYMLAKRWIRRI